MNDAVGKLGADMNNTIGKIELARRQNNSIYQRSRDLDAARAKVTVSTCYVKINNAGEIDIDFEFACKYAQLPTINFGYQLQSSTFPGRVPIFSASVKDYLTIERPPHSRLYTGATLSVVSESVDGLSFIVVATATGVAFSGPMGEY